MRGIRAPLNWRWSMLFWLRNFVLLSPSVMELDLKICSTVTIVIIVKLLPLSFSADVGAASLSLCVHQICYIRYHGSTFSNVRLHYLGCVPLLGTWFQDLYLDQLLIPCLALACTHSALLEAIFWTSHDMLEFYFYVSLIRRCCKILLMEDCIILLQLND